MTRPMREFDIPHVSELLRESYVCLGQREQFSDSQTEFLVSERCSPETIRRESREQRHLVADDGLQITGVVSVLGNEITKLYVDRTHLRRGIGTALFAAASDVIAQAGYRELWLGTIFPATLPFYKAMGMAEAGRRPVGFGPMIGTEFVPTLEEGSILIGVTMAPSTSLDK